MLGVVQKIPLILEVNLVREIHIEEANRSPTRRAELSVTIVKSMAL